MKNASSLGLLILVFWLVAASFATIYITQPILPVLQTVFGVNETMASLTISAVILGIAIANLPFGILADRYPVRPIILIGGSVVTVTGLICSLSDSLLLIIAARFIQGLFIPSLTTCVAAFLSTRLPPARLNVIMGSYVSATVAGGLGGRLLGGWLFPPEHWRYAFITSSVILFLATIAAVLWLPKEEDGIKNEPMPTAFFKLIRQAELLRIYLVAFGAFFVFSSIFNYLPFYLTGPPFNLPTDIITYLYLSYIIGIIMGPLAGKLSNRIGNGSTMMLGSAVFGVSIWISLIQSVITISLSLAGVCAGFFAIHAAAAGSLNRKLKCSRGRGNSLYVLFYYLGGFAGINISGFVYAFSGWPGIIAMGTLMLLIPAGTGLSEIRKVRRESVRE